MTLQVRRIVALVWSERRLYLTGVIFVALSIGTGLAYPQVIRLIIDDGVQAGRTARLNQLAILLVGILLVESAATVARDYCFGLGAERVAARLRRMVFETLLRQDIQFFDRRETGEITTRLWADVPPLQFVLGEELADAIRFSVFAVCGTGLLFYTSVPLTLLTLLAVPPIVMASSLLGRRVRTLSTDVQRAHAEAGASATEVIGGIRTVRAFSREEAETRTLRAADGARARVRAPEDRRGLGAGRRLVDRRRVCRDSGHLGWRPPDRQRPPDHRRAHLVHPLRAARGARIPQRVAVLGRVDARRRRHAVDLRARRHHAADPARRRRSSGGARAVDRARRRAVPLSDADRSGSAQGDRSAHRAGRSRGAGRQVGIGQVDAAEPAAAVLRSRPRAASASAAATFASSTRPGFGARSRR